ncbi:MAG: antibiotic biosynthesis monooxygenase [Microscillaceae bacterium]|nr:antibiotic biosynthesis monooxygenase [Microscillaceae bacterium]
MENSSIVVVAKIILQADKIAEALAAIETLVAGSQAEAGVIHYHAHQSRAEATEILFYEKYENKEALKAHTQSAHFLAFSAQAPGFLAGTPEIKQYQFLY